MGCGGCSRIILIIFNIIFFLVGAAALGVGIWVLVDNGSFLSLLSNLPDSNIYAKMVSQAAYILIAAGAAIFIIAFFGCCGAWKKNKCMLVTYAVILGILLLLEIGAVVVAYFFYDEVESYVVTGLVLALNFTYKSEFTMKSAGVYEYASNEDFLSKSIDAIQIEFTCCGVNNYTDYPTGNWPVSCCEPAEKSDLKGLANTLFADGGEFKLANSSCASDMALVENVPGCKEDIKNYVLNRGVIFMAIGGGTLGVQLLLVIMAICVCKSDDRVDVEKM